jgi:hypothetical protein
MDARPQPIFWAFNETALHGIVVHVFKPPEQRFRAGQSHIIIATTPEGLTRKHLPSAMQRCCSFEVTQHRGNQISIRLLEKQRVQVVRHENVTEALQIVPNTALLKLPEHLAAYIIAAKPVPPNGRDCGYKMKRARKGDVIVPAEHLIAFQAGQGKTQEPCRGE